MAYVDPTLQNQLRLQPQATIQAAPSAPAAPSNPYGVTQGTATASQIENQQNNIVTGASPGLPTVWGQGGGSANSYSNQVQQLGNAMGTQQAPSLNNQFAAATAADQAAYAQNQQAQQANLAQLLAQANGTAGPSAADIAQQQQTQQAQAANVSMARGGAGASGSLAMRGVANANAAASINNTNQTSQLNAQQQAAALAQYNQAAQQYAQQSQGMQQNLQQFGLGAANMQESQNQNNVNNQLQAQQQAQNAQYAQLTADSNYLTGWENMQTQGYLANNAANASFTNSAIGGGTALGVGLMALSDANAKENITPASDADSFLSALEPYTFNYKAGTGEHPGTHLGVIAQNIERTPFGSTLIEHTPRGRAIKVAPALGASLASLGQINKRLRRLESRLGAR